MVRPPGIHFPSLDWTVREDSSIEEGDVAPQMMRFMSLRRDRDQIPLSNLAEVSNIVIRELARVSIDLRYPILVKVVVVIVL